MCLERSWSTERKWSSWSRLNWSVLHSRQHFVFNYLDKVEFWLHQQTNYTCCRHYPIIFFLFNASMQPHQTPKLHKIVDLTLPGHTIYNSLKKWTKNNILMTPLGRPGDKRGWVWRPAKPFSGSWKDHFNKTADCWEKVFLQIVDYIVYIADEKEILKNVCFLSCLTTTKMEYWTFVRHKSFSDVLVSRYSIQYFLYLMIHQQYMQIRAQNCQEIYFGLRISKLGLLITRPSGKWRTNEGNDWTSLSRYKVGRKSGFKSMEQPKYWTQKLIFTITIITSDKLPSPSMNTSALSLANAEQTLTRPPYLPFLSETLFSSSFSWSSSLPSLSSSLSPSSSLLQDFWPSEHGPHTRGPISQDHE